MRPDDDDWVRDYTAPICACQDTLPLTACTLASILISQKNTGFNVLFHKCVLNLSFLCTEISCTNNCVAAIKSLFSLLSQQRLYVQLQKERHKVVINTYCLILLLLTAELNEHFLGNTHISCELLVCYSGNEMDMRGNGIQVRQRGAQPVGEGILAVQLSSQLFNLQ